MLTCFNQPIVNGMTLTTHEKAELLRFSQAIADRDNGLSIIALVASRRDKLSCSDFNWIKAKYRAWLVFNEV